LDFFGGVTWRVVAKDENGIMVRADKAVTIMPFDEPRSMIGWKGNLEKAPFNGEWLVTEDGEGVDSDKYLPSNKTERRNEYGSNFYFESSVRQWLLDNFYQGLSEQEKSSIVNVIQGQEFWFGERFSDWKAEADNIDAWIHYDTSGIILNSIDNSNDPTYLSHINRIAPFDVQTGSVDFSKLNKNYGWTDKSARNIVGFQLNGATLDIDPETGLDNTTGKDYNGSWITDGAQYTAMNDIDKPLDASMLNEYRKLPQIMFDDPIFLPSWIQAFEIQASRLKNEIGGNYSQVIKVGYDSSNFDINNDIRVQNIWSRSPAMRHGGTVNFLVGTHVLTYSDSNLKGKHREDPQTGTNIFTGHTSANSQLGVVPALYLSNDIQLEYFGVRGYNPNEEDIVREQPLDGSSYNYRGWVLPGIANNIESIDNDDFAKLKVGESFSMLLSAGNYQVEGSLPNGLELIPIANGIAQAIFGIPTDAKQFNFKLISDNVQSTDITVNVLKGDTYVSIADALVGYSGQSLSDLELPEIVYEIPGKLQWQQDDILYTKEDYTQYFDIEYVPDDQDNYNNQSMRVQVEIRAEFSKDDFVNLTVGEPFEIEVSGANFELIDGKLPDGLEWKIVGAKSYKIAGVPIKKGSYEFEIARKENGVDYDNPDGPKPRTTHINLTVEIGTPKPHFPENIVGMVGKKLREIVLPNTNDSTSGTWYWINPDLVLDGKPGTVVSYQAKFVPTDQDNYRSIITDVNIYISSEYERNDILFWVLISGGIAGLIVTIFFILIFRRKKDGKGKGDGDNLGKDTKDNSIVPRRESSRYSSRY